MGVCRPRLGDGSCINKSPWIGLLGWAVEGKNIFFVPNVEMAICPVLMIPGPGERESVSEFNFIPVGLQ